MFPEMVQNLIQKKKMLIYSTDGEENNNQHKQNLSTTCRSDENKHTFDSSEISYLKTIEMAPQTKIVKIHSQIQQDNIKFNQIELIPASITAQKNHEIFMFKYEEEEAQNEENDDFEKDSPIKLKKSRRKRLDSPLKRKKQFSEHITDEEYTQQMQYQQNRTEIQNNQNSNQFQRKSIMEKRNFQMIKKDQNSQKIQKLNNWLEIQDSERYLSLRKDLTKNQRNEDVEKDRMKIFYSKRSKIEKEMEMKKEKELQSCQILMNNLDDNFQEQMSSSQKEEEQIYENQCFQEENNIMLNQNKNKKKQTNTFKVFKQLPKQIFVQTTLESLVMKPVPKGLKMICNFFIETRFLGISKQYNIVMKQTGKTLLSAKKQHFSFSGSKFIISFNENFISKRKENHSWTGTLQSNFSGTKYELTSRKFPNLSNSSLSNSFKVPRNEDNNDEATEFEETLAAVISFENNLWGFSGIRKMNILKLDESKLNPKDLRKNTTLEEILERNQISKLIKIETTKPEYNKMTKRYILNFENKVKIPSAKNIILHWKVPESTSISEKNSRTKLVNSFSNIEWKSRDESTELRSGKSHLFEAQQRLDKGKEREKLQCLLIGKQSEKQYLVQVGYPLSLFEAFGACLANEDTKYMVN